MLVVWMVVEAEDVSTDEVVFEESAAAHVSTGEGGRGDVGGESGSGGGKILVSVAGGFF